VVKAASDHLEASPEMGYLLSLVCLQAERALGGVRLETRKSAALRDALAETAGPVLLLGEEDVLVGEASLRAMARELANGADVVVPRPITGYPALAEQSLYTLRDFERFEARCLGGELEPADAEAVDSGAPLLPVSLWRAEAWNRSHVAADRGAADADLRRARAGVFHAFIDYYGELRDDIRPWVPTGARDVLEIGCGSGRTGRWLQDELGCRVTGVELHPWAAAQAARHLHRVHQGDVAEVELEGPFDLVVALELFEHLPEPEPVLRRMRQALRPGGRILLSVPNVGHYSVVADLAAGRWDYLPIGLLCYTHYRFFTRRTLEDWLERLGFERHRLEPQITPLPRSADPLLRLPDADPESLATKGFYVIVDVR
jgi:SAM-dependent methyltransferase